MGEQLSSEAATNLEFKLLSVASLLKRIHNGISIEELHKNAERKFDTLVSLLSDTYKNETILNKFGYSLEDLKQMSLLIFDQLISEKHDNPFQTLCVLEGYAIEEIKRRRNMLLQIFHPDRNSIQISSTSKTRIINDAYNKIVILYDETNMPSNANQTTIPPSYPYIYSDKMKNPRTIMLIMIFVFAVLGFMIKFLLY